MGADGCWLFGDHALIDQVGEGLRDQGIELGARAVANFLYRFIEGQGGLVARAAGHGIERFADTNDSSLE